MGALSLHGPVLEMGGERALAKVERRLGLPVRAERFYARDASRAGLARLRVGPADAPILTARTVEADISEATQWSLSPWPSRVEVTGVVVHVQGDGTLEGAARALKALAEQRVRSAGGDVEGASPRRPRPSLVVRDARLIDHSGGLLIEDGALTWEDDSFKGTARVVAPPLGKCTLNGNAERIMVDCAEAITVPLPGGVAVVASGARYDRGGAPKVTLTQVRLQATRAASRLANMVDGLTVDLTLELSKDAQGRRPVQARFQLPGGGHIIARGTASEQQAEIRAKVSNLSLDSVHRTVQGSLSGEVRATIDRASKRLEVGGDIRFQRFHVTHQAIAEGPIGPFTFGLKGQLTVDVPGRDLKKLKATLIGGEMQIGEVVAHLEGNVDNTGEALTVAGTARVDPLDAEMVSRAIPPGLTPHLQPLRAAGRFALDARLAIDMANLKDTVLEAKLDKRRLKIVEMNERINFRRLRKQFYTRFEMPDGEIIVRKTGPQSGRWTPLDAVPPLLPAAIMAQEDGGFMRHGGVSMLHLRGSLIRNLERGRFARGGSTMTMQLARNLFLNRRKTLSRKLEEVILAWQLEKNFSKQELLALYLNVVEFGEEVFGIGDAARHYFHKSPTQLTPVEIAFLTRLLPAPRTFGKQFERNAVDKRYGKRMMRLLRRLVKLGKLSQAAYEKADPAQLWQTAPPDELGVDPTPLDQEDAPPPGELEIPDGW